MLILYIIFCKFNIMKTVLEEYKYDTIALLNKKEEVELIGKLIDVTDNYIELDDNKVRFYYPTSLIHKIRIKENMVNIFLDI